MPDPLPSEWSRVEPGDGTPPYDVYLPGILDRPNMDPYTYRILRLDNGIDVVVAAFEQPTCALSVHLRVGWASDPVCFTVKL